MGRTSSWWTPWVAFGIYATNQPEELDRVMHDASLLINRGG